ncbi:hypothetical protein CAFE_20620 [Caprobacter fermentans]|uniref:Homeodomain phBC6A51-type domain-containing protein n=1 Tax=Caproicibacter fermentans TaxID=2576756 RepID=A0A6N8I0B6_9FIRM|nr:hypothetical protein [Caproicibacter fermentans]MVB11348.1 hypothetical protein [Caproicibacter fermentans]
MRVNEEKLIAALLSSNSTKEASLKSGVAERTIYTYKQKPEFKQRLNQAKTEMLEMTVAKLSNSTAEATEVLADVMKDKEANPQTRIYAARSVLEFAAKYTDTVDVAQRLEALERRQAENSSKTEGWME